MLAPIARGILLGIANVLVVALGLLALSTYDRHPSTEVPVLVLQLGIGPGIVAGAVLGALAGRLRRHRVPIIVGLALAVVVALGQALAPGLIPFALPSTLLLAAALEHGTRPPRRRGAPSVRPTAALKGVVLGAYAVGAVACVVGTLVMIVPALRGWAGDGEEAGWGFGPYIDRHSGAGLQIGMIIAIIGSVPGLIAGACLGRLTDELATWSPAPRALVLATLSMAAVAILGVLTHQEMFIAPACVPVVAAAIALERWTRVLVEHGAAVSDDEDVPRARAAYRRQR